MTDHALSALFQPAPNIYPIRRSPQSTDGRPMVPTDKSYAFARQAPTDSRKINTVYPSSTSTTKTIVLSSGSAGENVRATTPSQRKLITVAMPLRHRMLASTLSRVICPPLAVTAWFWRVSCGLCDLDAPTLAQPDIVPHRS